MHRRTLAEIERSALQCHEVSRPSHLAAESIYLIYEVSLRSSSDRGVAGHICDRIEAHGKQHRADPHSRRGKCRLDSGMPRSYYGYLYFVVHRV